MSARIVGESRAHAVLVHAGLIALTALSLAPLLWMLLVSFMQPSEASHYPPPLWPGYGVRRVLPPRRLNLKTPSPCP